MLLLSVMKYIESLLLALLFPINLLTQMTLIVAQTLSQED